LRADADGIGFGSITLVPDIDIVTMGTYYRLIKPLKKSEFHVPILEQYESGDLSDERIGRKDIFYGLHDPDSNYGLRQLPPKRCTVWREIGAIQQD